MAIETTGQLEGVEVLIVDGIGGLDPAGLSADAQMFVDVVSRRLPDATIDVLINQDLTTRELTLAISALRARSARMSVFYFTGYGHANDFESYLVTRDGLPGAEGCALSSVIRGMPHGPGQSWIAILDCCHVDVEQFGWARGQLSVPASLQGVPGDKAVLSASTAETEALLDHASASPFTTAVCEGLDGAAATRLGEVTLGSLYDYVSGHPSMSAMPPPTLSGDLTSAFTFVSGLEPGSLDPESDPDVIAVDASRYAESVHSHVVAADADWLQSGWLSSARKLEPVVRWFERQSARGKPQRTEEFSQALSVIDRYHRYVATVSPGIETGRGRVTRLLGKGGFGSVWTLTGPDGADAGAMKVYTPDELNNYEKVARFARGYRAMKQLNHPGIVTVHDFYEVPAAIFMDLVPGQDLEAANPLRDIASVLTFIEQIARILRYSHQQEVIHRDLKPANIIAKPIDGKVVPVLTDFDLAWFATATQITRVAMGWAFYAAPEQIQAPTSDAARRASVDVYSLMQVMYYLVTDQDPRPFDTQENSQKLGRVMEFQGVNPSAMDAVLELYLSGSVAKPGQRMQRMDDVIAGLQRAATAIDGDGRPTVFSFHAFIQRAASLTNWQAVNSVGSGKATAQSPTTRSTFEMIHEPAKGQIVVRLKSFDLPGLRNASGSRGFWQRQRERVQAGVLANSNAFAKPLPNSGLSLVQLNYPIATLNGESAKTFGAAVRRIYSAMERVA